MDILQLSNGKVLSIDSAELTQQEALEAATRLFQTWGLQHPRVKRTLTYDVETSRWNDCPHVDAADPNWKEQVQDLVER